MMHTIQTVLLVFSQLDKFSSQGGRAPVLARPMRGPWSHRQ